MTMKIILQNADIEIVPETKYLLCAETIKLRAL